MPMTASPRAQTPASAAGRIGGAGGAASAAGWVSSVICSAVGAVGVTGGLVDGAISGDRPLPVAPYANARAGFPGTATIDGSAEGVTCPTFTPPVGAVKVNFSDPLVRTEPVPRGGSFCTEDA
jgi:hypothetical protein